MASEGGLHSQSAEFSGRRDAVAAGLDERKLDALLVAFSPNLRYLTGFTGSNGNLLITPGRAILFTDPRYTIQAANETDLPGTHRQGSAVCRRFRRNPPHEAAAHRVRARTHDVRSAREPQIEAADASGDGAGLGTGHGMDRRAADDQIDR